MGGFTGNNSGVRKVLVVILFLFMAGGLGWCQAKAEVPEGLTVGFGKAAIDSTVSFDALLITQEIADRRWLAVFVTHGAGEYKGEHVRANMGAGIVRTTHLRPLSVGIGAGVFERGDRGVGPLENQARPQLGAFILLRRYLVKERLTLDLLHFSSGGAAEWNPGKNWVTLSVRF